MRSKSKEMAFVVVGLLLAAAGLAMLRWMPVAWSGPLPYVCLGVGGRCFRLGEWRTAGTDPRVRPTKECASPAERRFAARDKKQWQ